MKKILLVLLFYSCGSYGQTTVQGTVKDLKTKVPLPFCAVSVKGNIQGCITNEEGVFTINVDAKKDSLVFSYIGYKTRTVSARIFFINSEILLESKSIPLKEVIVSANNDFLFTVLEKCRDKMKTGQRHVSRVYFQLETEKQKKPVEMLEGYYNGTVKGNAIEKLQLKNGRIGIAESEHGYFVNTNTSKAITDIDLTVSNDFIPLIPFQLSNTKAKKLFDLKLFLENTEDNIYHIEFTPRKNDGTCFSGEAWIDKATFSLLKIYLFIENAARHPFISLFEDDSLSNVSLRI